MFLKVTPLRIPEDGAEQICTVWWEAAYSVARNFSGTSLLSFFFFSGRSISIAFDSLNVSHVLPVISRKDSGKHFLVMLDYGLANTEAPCSRGLQNWLPMK